MCVELQPNSILCFTVFVKNISEEYSV